MTNRECSVCKCEMPYGVRLCLECDSKIKDQRRIQHEARFFEMGAQSILRGAAMTTHPEERDVGEVAREIWRDQLLDLRDRRGIKNGFEGLDTVAWEELEKDQERILEQALKAHGEAEYRRGRDENVSENSALWDTVEEIGYLRGLEDAAKVCEEMLSEKAAKEIRALKGGDDE